MRRYDGWERVGEIGVDAGLCWVGDPCYILHKTKATTPKGIGKNWGDFCDLLEDKATQFNYDRGHAGLGVCVSTGYGDGTYPVFIKRNHEGRVAEVKVVFDGMEED